MKRSGFPLYPLRLLAAVAAWNVFIYFDRVVLRYSLAGPFSLLALAGMTAVCVSLPWDKVPGSWFVRDSRTVWRYRWIFWFIALSSGGILVLIMINFWYPL